MAGAEWISAGAAAAAALAGGAVAVATYRLASSTNRLAELTAKTLATAERQVEETALTRADAVRARVDERAPRVIVILAPTEWPPYAPPRGVGDTAHQMEVTREFVTPRQDDTLIMFRTCGLMRNEGPTTATVTLNGRASFVPGVGPFRGCASVGVPVSMGPPGQVFEEVFKEPVSLGGGRYALAPGEEAIFRFDDWRPLRDWRKAWQHQQDAPPESKLLLEIIVADQFDDGIVDNISVEVQGYPVEPFGDDLGRWKIRYMVPVEGTSSAVGSTVHPAKRRYWKSKRANEPA